MFRVTITQVTAIAATSVNANAFKTIPLTMRTISRSGGVVVVTVVLLAVGHVVGGCDPLAGAT